MSKTGSDSINYSCVIDFPFYDFWIRFWNCMGVFVNHFIRKTISLHLNFGYGVLSVMLVNHV